MPTPENDRDRQQEALEAPPGLVAALNRASKPPIFIPPTVDEAILHSARRHLSRRVEPGPRWALIFRWVAAAATVVLLLAILPRFVRKPTPAPTGFASGDVSHDGQIDILDAFALARALKTGTPPNPRLDVNGDGVVDERDVAALAARAVRLEKGGRS
jgi:hypothetical protein